MRVCVLTTSYPRFVGDDAGIFVERLVNPISNQADSVLLIVPSDYKAPLEEQRGTVQIKRFSYTFFGKGGLAFGAGIPTNIKTKPALVIQFPGLFLQMLRLLVKHKNDYDLVHANWIFSAAVAYVAKFFTGKKYLITIRGSEVKLFNKKLFQLLFAPVVKSASYTVSVNNSFLELLNDLYKLGNEKLKRIPNGVDLPPVQREDFQNFILTHKFDLKKTYIVFVGTLFEGKGIHFLIDLINEPELKDFELILCGRDNDKEYLRTLKEKIQKHGCAQRVHFQGAVKPLDIPFYLKLARYFVTASYSEGMPNAVLEALSAGRVVLASDIDAHKELIKDGENGFLFERDTKVAAKQIMNLEASHELRERIAQAGKDSIQKLSWESSASQYVALYQDLI